MVVNFHRQNPVISIGVSAIMKKSDAKYIHNIVDNRLKISEILLM